MYAQPGGLSSGNVDTALIYLPVARKLIHIKTNITLHQRNSLQQQPPTQLLAQGVAISCQSVLSFMSVVAKKNWCASLATSSTSASNPILDPSNKMSCGQFLEACRCTIQPTSP